MLIVPSNKHGNECIFVVVDRLSKMALVHIGKIAMFYLQCYGQNWPYCRKIEELKK
jgi:hypothetical protein